MDHPAWLWDQSTAPEVRPLSQSPLLRVAGAERQRGSHTVGGVVRLLSRAGPTIRVRGYADH